MKKVALATYRSLPLLASDDQFIVPALATVGIEAVPVCWDDPSADWTKFDGVILRSVWDYSFRIDEFLGWLRKLDALSIRVFNPVSVVQRNVRKTYLRDFESAGIRCIPTLWAADLEQLLEKAGSCDWPELVIKPSISAEGVSTYRVSRESFLNQGLPAKLKQSPEYLLQRYLSHIETEGEWSLLFYGGRYSHAVLNTPKSGDFRVQTIHGGSTVLKEAPRSCIEFAEKALSQVGKDLLYARVDLIRESPGSSEFLLGELELTEPTLYFGYHPDAPRRFALAVKEKLY